MCNLEYNPVLTVDVRKCDRLRSGLNYKNEKYGRQAEQCAMGKPSPILEPESLVTRLQLVIVATFHCLCYGILFTLPQRKEVAILGRRHGRKDWKRSTCTRYYSNDNALILGQSWKGAIFILISLLSLSRWTFYSRRVTRDSDAIIWYKILVLPNIALVCDCQVILKCCNSAALYFRVDFRQPELFKLAPSISVIL